MFDPNSEWRRVSSSIYRKPTDSKILGSVELDVTELEVYLKNQREKGIKLTYTHFFAFAIASGIKEKVPQFNTFVRRGKIVSRKTIDVAVSVLNHDATEMSAVVVKDFEKYNLKHFTQKLNLEIVESKKGTGGVNQSGKKMLAKIPWPFRALFFRLIRFITLDLGITSSFIGANPNQFGTFVLSNIGSVGLDVGYPALLPASNVSAVFTMGNVETLPRYVNDELLPRRILKLAATMDHRVVDGLHGGLLFKYLKWAIKHPQAFEIEV